jgi:hypothetical protein
MAFLDFNRALVILYRNIICTYKIFDFISRYFIYFINIICTYKIFDFISRYFNLFKICTYKIKDFISRLNNYGFSLFKILFNCRVVKVFDCNCVIIFFFTASFNFVLCIKLVARIILF